MNCVVTVSAVTVTNSTPCACKGRGVRVGGYANRVRIRLREEFSEVSKKKMGGISKKDLQFLAVRVTMDTSGKSPDKKGSYGHQPDRADTRGDGCNGRPLWPQ